MTLRVIPPASMLRKFGYVHFHLPLARSFCSEKVSYIQGQEPEKGVREYFYYIDHQGMLFLDDSKIKNFTSCFKDKQFLTFFFRRLKKNNTGRYEEHFPFWSDCGKERNFVRGDDVPIVYTHVTKKIPRGASEEEEHLCFGHAGDVLSFKFHPQNIYMAETGRVYHPGPANAGSVGLISSKLAIEFSKNFLFQGENTQCPTHFVWNNNEYVLDSSWIKNLTAQGNL
ncbi:UPF0598 protein C8orf82-like protein [Frankliniella fusca]|uniref:UPF0598 protein C8orf82-like protein n=1 Tax=Frankliniella fusca TaxID=407009 RepID=A0AAE1LVB1_9NEOP|nr:UPF0598 protein C8orf82-like protein [Frankliniella fusca]